MCILTNTLMEIQYVRIPNARLTEGKIYPFRIVKTVSLGPDDNWFVLKDPNGYKILLPEAYYKSYGFETGIIIKCRVDKVNCNGKVFLEPLHPVYKEGDTYTFEVIGKEHQKDILNEDRFFIIVKDVFSNVWKVPVYSMQKWENLPTVIACRVNKIKKGTLYLAPAGELPVKLPLKTGQYYTLTIVSEVTDKSESIHYFILEDQSGVKHLLNKQFYRNYGFKTGDVVRCFVAGVSDKGSLILEPDHPCYETGNMYQFPVDRLEERIFSDGFKQKVLVLLDCYGNEFRLHVDDALLAQLKQKRLLQARVSRIYKGKPELSITEEQPI